VTHLIKLVIVPKKATQSATTVVEKVTSPANARLLPNQNPATDVAKKVTSHVIAQTKSLARAVAAVDGAAVLVAATPAVVVTLAVAAAAAAVAAVVKTVTSVVKSVTLHATAPRVEELVTAVGVGMAADTAAEVVVVVVAAAAAARPATPAAASATCLATAPRVRSATIVSLMRSLSSRLPTNKV
jgi:hypothetical protein